MTMTTAAAAAATATYYFVTSGLKEDVYNCSFSIPCRSSF